MTYPGGPLVMEKRMVYLERGPFSLAVQACLAVAKRGRDAASDGNKVVMHPTNFRMATELRKAFRRVLANHGIEVDVQEWDEIIREAGKQSEAEEDG